MLVVYRTVSEVSYGEVVVDKGTMCYVRVTVY